MTKPDRVIAELMNALDLIEREARTGGKSLAYICGVVKEAREHCDARAARDAWAARAARAARAYYTALSEEVLRLMRTWPLTDGAQ